MKENQETDKKEIMDDPIGDLLSPNAPKVGKGMGNAGSGAQTTNREKSKQITFSHLVSTKDLLDDLVWLKSFKIDEKDLTQGDVIREALELLAKEIDYEKLRKKYADKLDKHRPKVGRKRR
ncbi:MAG: hypothetical protein AAF575_00275 [Bacteroidota bacterium]